MTENGRILRDNVYGSIDEDAWRRDFTINALYYDISDFSLLDYANGLADLQAGIIRLIGDPYTRYQEDPVRMIRAIRFAAKLHFTISPETANPIYELGELLKTIPPARLFEEVQKLFLSGHAASAFHQMRHYQLFKQLFPFTEACLGDENALPLIEEVLRNTDERLSNQKTVTPAFFLAALLWPPLKECLPEVGAKGKSQQELFLENCHQLLFKQQKYVSIPRRISVFMQEIWLLQLRLTRRNRGKKCYVLLEHPRFRAGYDFLLLRARAGEPVEPIAQWWTDFIQADDPGRQALLSQPVVVKRSRRRRRRKNKKTDSEETE